MCRGVARIAVRNAEFKGQRGPRALVKSGGSSSRSWRIFFVLFSGMNCSANSYVQIQLNVYNASL